MSMTTTLSFPVGVRPLIGPAARRRRALENRCTDVLDAAGYEEIILPIVDFAQPYADLQDEAELRRSYRFTDREGELIAIRSDFTPMVARVISRLVPAESPLRVFYRGDVIRCEASRLGREREFFQVGAELVGDPAPAADAEIVMLAARIVRANGRRPIVTFTDASILSALLEYSAVPRREWPSIAAAIRAKRGDQLESLLEEMRSEEAGLLRAFVRGTLELSDMAASRALAAIATRLNAITETVRINDIEFVPVLDDVDVSTYYSGLRFTVYAEGIETAIGRGGRYDTLYERFGGVRPAVGFTLSPEPMLALQTEDK